MSPRAGLTPDRVVAAAADLADEEGFDKLTVSALARRLGVRDASLYSHVKNLADLRTRVMVLALDEWADRIATAVAGRSGRDALAAFAGAYRAFAVERPGRYASTQIRVEPGAVPATSAARRIAELTYATVGAYGLAEPDLTDAIRLLRSAFHGYATFEAGGGFGHPRDVQASWDRAVEALHTLLEHWPRASEHEPESS